MIYILLKQKPGQDPATGNKKVDYRTRGFSVRAVPKSVGNLQSTSEGPKWATTMNKSFWQFERHSLQNRQKGLFPVKHQRSNQNKAATWTSNNDSNLDKNGCLRDVCWKKETTIIKPKPKNSYWRKRRQVRFVKGMVKGKEETNKVLSKGSKEKPKNKNKDLHVCFCWQVC